MSTLRPILFLVVLVMVPDMGLRAQTPDSPFGVPTQPDRPTTYYMPVSQALTILEDDKAGPNSWIQAAEIIVLPSPRPPACNLDTPIPATGFVSAGESLRIISNPSVSELLVKRINSCFDSAQASSPSQTTSDLIPSLPQGSPARPQGSSSSLYMDAAKLAEALADWDGKNQLAELRALSERFSQVVEQDPKQKSLNTALASILAKRVDLQDASAVGPLLSLFPPPVPSESTGVLLSPPSTNYLRYLWERPNNPLLAQAGEQFLSNPQNGWTPIIDPQRNYQLTNTLYTPLIGLPYFRKSVINALQNTQVVSQTHSFELDALLAPYYLTWQQTTPEAMGDSQFEVRICDIYAMALSNCPSIPAFDPMGTTDQKNNAILKMIAFLNQYGNAYQYRSPFTGYSNAVVVDNLNGVQPRFPYNVTKFYLDPLDHPATSDDVQAGKAIFTLNAPGRSKVLALPSVPVLVQTTKIDPSTKHGTMVCVWQAESLVDDAGVVQTFYGYTGDHEMGLLKQSDLEPASLAQLAPLPPGSVPPSPGTPGTIPTPAPTVSPELAWSISPQVEGEVGAINGIFAPGAAITLNFKLRNLSGSIAPLPEGFCPAPTDKGIPIALTMEKFENYPIPPNGAPSTASHDLMGSDGPHTESAPDLATWHSMLMKPQPASAFVPPPPPAPAPTIPPNGEYLLGSVDITSLYDLSKLGAYRMTIGRPGAPPGDRVTIHFIVGYGR